MARKFGGLFAFAYARPGGGLDHPTLIPHVDAIVAAVAGPAPGPTPLPAPPPPPVPPPAPFSPRVPAVLQGPPPTPVAPPRQYPHVSEVKDPAVQQSLRLLWDAHFGLLEQQTQIKATQATHTATLTSLGSQVTTAQQTASFALNSGSPNAGPTGGQPAPTPPPGPPSPGPSPPPSDDGGQGSLGCSQAGPTGHVPPGSPITPLTAGQIVCGTFNEFSSLGAVVVDQPTRDANRLELLGRMIWHLALAGFPSDYYPGNPFDLLIQIGTTVYAYRVTDYATFDVPMFSTMVFGGTNPGPIGAPAGGIAD